MTSHAAPSLWSARTSCSGDEVQRLERDISSVWLAARPRGRLHGVSTRGEDRVRGIVRVRHDCFSLVQIPVPVRHHAQSGGVAVSETILTLRPERWETLLRDSSMLVRQWLKSS